MRGQAIDILEQRVIVIGVVCSEGLVVDSETIVGDLIEPVEEMGGELLCV